MDKKMYNKPDMKVVLLRHRASLLAGSDTPQSDNGEGASIPSVKVNATMNDTWYEENI